MDYDYDKKNIIVGDVIETFTHMTPINVFQTAIKLSEQKNFFIKTNNPQFVEALEVLCGEDNIDIYLSLNDGVVKIDFMTAYNYLGDVYDIINTIRFIDDLGGTISDEKLDKEINEYKLKYSDLVKENIR